MLTTSNKAGGRVGPAMVVVATAAVAIAVRFAFVNEVNSDYRAFLSPWYDALSAGGGLRAIGQQIGNYNPPYLYLLAVMTYLPIPKIIAIKLVSMVFDVVLAAFAGLIVRRRFNSWTSAVAFAVVLAAPTVLLNSGYWGQCDSIYAAFCLGSLYFLLRGRSWWACVFFGLALSFKLQAIFFLPVLLIVLVANRRRLLPLLAVPVTFLVMLLPAAVAGRSWRSLLTVYPDQVTGGAGSGFGRAGGGFGGGAPSLSGGLGAWTQNGPTMFQWVGGSVGWEVFGLVVAAGLLLGLGVLAWRTRPLGEPQIILLTTATVLAVPFFLPQMHERYFYLADVMTIVAAFYLRRFWPVAVAVSASSLLAYAPFLWRITPVPLPLVSFLEFLAVVATLVAAAHVLTTPGSRWIRGSTIAVANGRWEAPEWDPALISPSGGRPAERPPSPA
ncbi:glycosyltransferase 87 family protein [Nakamurella sp.]|uniref:glycosyltransferase 87 family protein n=1 Tax=Nakamurella sp. TaxID=1869182 RepID=UPI003784046E